MMARRLTLLAGLLVFASGGGALPTPAQQDQQEQEQQEQEKEEEKKSDPQESGVEEHVVVSASATGDERLDAPAAVDVIDSEHLEQRPADHLADQLRRVPGVNVVQFSSRDVNIASRSSTGGINNSTLALSDGRSLYQDFLGFVLWEFAPSDPDLVDRVEVVRGPASALWGANAVGGVVHVVTKSARDTIGRSIRAGLGTYDTREVHWREGFLSGPWAFRVSGSLYQADPFDRPETITNFFGDTLDPDLGLIDHDSRKAGTVQPNLDLRADWQGSSGEEWILQGGTGRTGGWIMTGLGPFEIDRGASQAHLQARYLKGPYEAQVYSNFFDGDAQNLINALDFAFRSTLTHASLRSRTIPRPNMVLGWGLEVSRSSYDLSIAPEGDVRSIAGAFGELSVALTPRFGGVLGGRFDHFRETIGTTFSPRFALRFKPRDNQTLRLAYGRAFRAPSVIENYLSVPSIPVRRVSWAEADAEAGAPLFTLLAEFVCQNQPDNCGAPPGEVPDYIVVLAANGNLDLDEEVTDSIELGYAAQFGPVSLAATIYQNRTRRGIDFPQVASYGSGPDGVPGTADDIILPSDPDGDGIDEAPAVDVCQAVSALTPFDALCQAGPVTYPEFLSLFFEQVGVDVPAEFAYDNSTPVDNLGVEWSLDWRINADWSAWLNYSWQDVPETDGISMYDEIGTVLEETESQTDLDGDGAIADTSPFVNIPAKHRIAVGATVNRPRWFATATYDFIDGTFWQDVGTSDFWGFVPSYSLVGISGGWQIPGPGLELKLQVTNLLDEPIQQHIIGDVIERRATLSLTYRDRPTAP